MQAMAGYAQQGSAREACAPLDAAATAAAPWKEGDVVAHGYFGFRRQGPQVERQFLGATADGFYLVQEFYAEGGGKFTDAFLLMEPLVTKGGSVVRDPVLTDGQQGICGPLVVYAQDGSKIIEGHFDHEGYISGHWIRWRDERAGEKFWEGNYEKGERVGERKVWDWEYSNGRLTVSHE